MTTPDIRGSSEELGIVEVYGAPFSTFTRTITLALHHLQLPFVFRHHPPHSSEIKAHNPLGLVPVLVHRPNPLFAPKQNVVLYESNAIRRYIDDALSTIAHGKGNQVSELNPRLDSRDPQALLKTAGLRAAVDQIASIASTAVFTALEARIIKVRQGLEQNKADEGTITVAVDEAMEGGHLIVDLLEGFLKENLDTNGARTADWFVGDNMSWADLYVYPILADLMSIPEGPKLLEKTPLLKAWVGRMEATPPAKATYPQTVADMRRRGV